MTIQTSLEYLRPNTCITLREGIQELRQAEGVKNNAAENITPELADILDVHDAIHVLFACQTNLMGEIKAHIWKVFGTTLKLQEMHRVNRHQDHRKVLAKIGHGRLIRTWFQSILTIAITLFRATQMKQRWPAEDYALFLDTPLTELRKQFGLHLPPQKKASNNSSHSTGAAVRHINLGLR